MKKFVFASVMALASISLVSSPLLRAQDLSIKDPSEYNAYSMASTQADPAKKAQGLEDFLTKYPQSVAKNVVLNHCKANWGMNRQEYFSYALEAENVVNLKMKDFHGKAAHPERDRAIQIV